MKSTSVSLALVAPISVSPEPLSVRWRTDPPGDLAHREIQQEMSPGGFMKQIAPNSKLGLAALRSVFVPTGCAQGLVKDDTGQAAHCPETKRTEALPCPLIRKWLSCASRATLIGVLAFSGCTSEHSGEQEKGSAASKPAHKEVGEASWYGPGFQGQETSNGETFDQKKMTAAHPSLPMGTEAKVTNLENGKKVEVRINDRGPYVENRVIDLSSAAANKLEMKEEGTTQVKIETKPTKKKAGTVQSRKTKQGKKAVHHNGR